MAWRTVAALSRGPVPPREQFWLCRDRDCEIVYFSAEGSLLRTEDLWTTPGFKCGGDLLCYCLLIRRPEVEAELAARGTTTVPDRIADLVRSKGCACEVRNPTGKCCLGEVRAEVEEG